MSAFRGNVNDALLSLLCGVALLGAVRVAYALAVGIVPDASLIAGNDPLARLAIARLVLFAVLVVPLALLLAWPLATHAMRKSVDTALPGAACGAVLFLLLEWAMPQAHPFPRWMDIARAIVLFAALPLGAVFWWRR